MAQRSVGILQSRLKIDVARGGIHRRLNGRERAFKRAPLQRIGGNFYLHPHREIAEPLLGQGEVHIDGVEGLEGHNGVTGLEELSLLNLADAEATGEWRADRPFFDNRLELIHAGGGVLGLGLGGFHVGLRDHAGFAESTDALEVQAVEFRCGLGRAELGLLDRFVDLHERIASFHLRSRLEENPNDCARDLAGYHDAACGFHRADGLKRAGERFGGRLLDYHGLGRHLEGLTHFDEVHNLKSFHANDGANQDKEAEDGQENLFFHR